MKRESTLTNWEIIKNDGWFQLRGTVLNDSRWSDGEMVRTSMLEKIDFQKGIAETKNTIYRLSDA
jgi:hypothetical protein